MQPVPPGVELQGLPLGVTSLPEGLHFSVYSRHAEAIDLCLFEDPSQPNRETARVRLGRDMNDTWHAFLPDLPVGTLYGYRAHGIWKPEWGLWFNPRKLLLDPYAKAACGPAKWHISQRNLGRNGGPDSRDSAPHVAKGAIVKDDFDWQGDALLLRPWEHTIIYEMHVRGFTRLHPRIPLEIRGTYAGLAHPEAIAYLQDLGVTAVQLLPVHLHLDDGFLLAKKLINYWGYNTLGFFAPHHGYAAASEPQSQIDEFKTMVRALHSAGIEVILDVVYNHTAEGDEAGSNLSLRGLDNPSYYLMEENRRTVNYTGCGNTVNAAAMGALRLILDSLRYWVRDMHVDGFRFDLGATLGRNGSSFNREAAFFQAIAQDPILSRVKMITEPWDMGPDGYQVGGFPKPWHELNGRFRDKVRRFWCGDTGVTANFAKRFCGSNDIYGSTGRSPLTSVNFITSHDGFTLRDLWTYNNKHNEANGEDNRDGDSNNHSWNCGIEGETTDEVVIAQRKRLVRAMLATTFCALGVPFLTAGDERWRTQKGNNNAYCQDSEISWLDWSTDENAEDMLDFTRKLIALRKSHPALRRRIHYSGQLNPLTQRHDIAWLDRDCSPMSSESWHSAKNTFFAGLLDSAPEGGEPLLFMFNNGAKPVAFLLPAGTWKLVFNSAAAKPFPTADTVAPVSETTISPPRSVACLMLKA